MTALRAIDKFDKFGAEGVRLLLTRGRKDESGDFTRGAGLSDAQADTILAFMASGQPGRRAAQHVVHHLVGAGIVIQRAMQLPRLVRQVAGRVEGKGFFTQAAVGLQQAA